MISKHKKDKKPNCKPFIFIHINKCAGSSVESALSEYGYKKPVHEGFVINVADNYIEMNLDGIIGSQHWTTKEHFDIINFRNYDTDIYGILDWENYFKFAIVRNPWDRILSYYQKHIKNFSSKQYSNLKFNDWIESVYVNGIPPRVEFKRMYGSCWDWLVNDDGDMLVDEIFKMEELNEKWPEILKKLGISENINLPIENVSKIRFRDKDSFNSRYHYSKWYNENSRQIIEDNLYKDINNFNYFFEEE